MPRKKAVDVTKVEVVNALEAKGVEDIPMFEETDADDFFIDELPEESAAVFREKLREMDEKTKKVNASKRVKRDLYSSGRIVFQEGDNLSEIVTEEDIRREAFQKLNQSLVAGSVLKGTVVKAVKRNKSADNPGLPTAIVQMDDDDYFEIKIPFTDFLPKSQLGEIRGETAADKLNYMDLLINMRTGAKIRFIVKKLDETTGEVIASRTEAMVKNRRAKWFERDREGRFTIMPGDKVFGNVLYVDRARVCVEAFGIEQNLDIADVSWIRYSDLRQAPIKHYRDKEGLHTGSYHAGDVMQLRVIGLKRTFYESASKEKILLSEDEIAGKRVTPAGILIKLSAKECYENPDKKFFKDFAIGEKVEAEVTHVDENGIFCKLAGKRSGRILFNTESPYIPPVGTRCLVKVTRMDVEGYRINCEIVQSYR